MTESKLSNLTGASRSDAVQVGSSADDDLLTATLFIDEVLVELSAALELTSPQPYLRMALHLVKSHLEGRTVTATSLVASSGVPYATGMRKLKDMSDAGLIEQRPRTSTGRSFSLHPSESLLTGWSQTAQRLVRLAQTTWGAAPDSAAVSDYYYGGSYMANRPIQPPRVLPTPLKVAGGLSLLVHADPTFMVMASLKQQFEQIVGTSIKQRAFSIDRLRREALTNAERRRSHYDLIAVDLPWIGEFVAKGLLLPLDEVMDVNRLDPADFHPAGWLAAHWHGRPYAVPNQTTPELFFYRSDLFAEAGIAPPATTEDILTAARHFHDPSHGRYGIAWNAARGTALGHTFMTICADFGHPIIDLPAIAGGYDASRLAVHSCTAQLDAPRALQAAEFLLELMDVSPPNILSMSWYERVRPYAAGEVAMAYGYTLMAPYFELDPASPAHGNTGFMPHPPAPGCRPVAPVGGYVLGIPSNLAPERRGEAVEALIAFTSREAHKVYVLNGSRVVPRYSVGEDPEVSSLSPIFSAIEQMSARDELQFWPRPPIPQFSDLTTICGQELHAMLRRITTPREALKAAQARANDLLKQDTRGNNHAP